jgi:hypothetical protein
MFPDFIHKVLISNHGLLHQGSYISDIHHNQHNHNNNNNTGDDEDDDDNNNNNNNHYSQ